MLSWFVSISFHTFVELTRINPLPTVKVTLLRGLLEMGVRKFSFTHKTRQHLCPLVLSVNTKRAQ